MASLFDALEAEAFRKGLAARSKEASNWFAKNVAKLGKLGSGKVLADDRLKISISYCCRCSEGWISCYQPTLPTA